MAYAGATPWHGLGEKVTNNLSPVQMLKAAKIDWTVSKRDVAFKNSKGVWVPSKDKFVLARDTDDAALTMVGATYKPVQNEEAMDFFKKFVVAGKMKMETAGSLWGGRYIWALASIEKEFSVGKTDAVKSYLLLCQPHVHGKAMVMQYTAIRVVCWNTLNFALGSNLKGDGTAFRMPHSTAFDDAVKKQAETALGLASQQTDEFKSASILLSKKKIDKAKVEQYFNEVLQFDPSKAKADGLRVPRMFTKFQEALVHAPGHDLASAEGTLWGAMNAVTYVIDHEVGRDRGTALRNAWLGHLSNTKRRAFTVAVKMAK
jgi:phage/plasmid-like protein (TIGR03299 family)